MYSYLYLYIHILFSVHIFIYTTLYMICIYTYIHICLCRLNTYVFFCSVTRGCLSFPLLHCPALCCTPGAKKGIVTFFNNLSERYQNFQKWFAVKRKADPTGPWLGPGFCWAPGFCGEAVPGKGDMLLGLGCPIENDWNDMLSYVIIIINLSESGGQKAMDIANQLGWRKGILGPWYSLQWWLCAWRTSRTWSSIRFDGKNVTNNSYTAWTLHSLLLIHAYFGVPPREPTSQKNDRNRSRGPWTRP